MPSLLTAVAVGAAVLETACNPPSLVLPNVPDPLALILAALEALGIQIPQVPTIPMLPSGFCSLD